MWWSRRGDISFSDNLSKWIYRRLKHNAPPPLDCNHMHSQHLSHGYSATKENCHVCSLLEPNSIFWRELRWTVNVSPLLAPWCNKISPNFRQIVFCNISSWRDFPSTLGLITKLVGKKKKAFQHYQLSPARRWALAQMGERCDHTLRCKGASSPTGHGLSSQQTPAGCSSPPRVPWQLVLCVRMPACPGAVPGVLLHGHRWRNQGTCSCRCSSPAPLWATAAILPDHVFSQSSK